MNKYLYHKYIGWLVPILCIGLAFLHGLFLYGATTGFDDIYITYWAAKGLSNFGHIINYNGEAIEQSSSLLHVMLLAILHRLSGISMPVLGVLFSATMGGLTILAAWRLAVFLNLQSAWFVAFFLALFPYLVYLSFSGLETTLVALIVVLLIYSIIRFLTEKVSISIFLFTFLFICAYIMVRPEAIFVMLAFLIGIVVYFLAHNILLKKRFTYEKSYYVKFIILVGISLTIFTLLSFWRYQTFGQIFPQPVYAKASGIHLERLITGIEYFLEQYWIPSLVILTILVAGSLCDILLSPNYEKKNVSFMIMILFIVATLAFIVTSGGDWMSGGRFIVPILPLLVISGLYVITKIPQLMGNAILMSLALTAIFDAAKFPKYDSIGISLPLAKAVYSPVLQDFNLSENTFFWAETANRGHLRDIPFIIMLNTVIKRLLTTQPTPLTIFTSQMGMIPFYITPEHFKQIQFLDRFALTTNDFTNCRITKHLYKGRFGIQLSYWYFFQHFDDIRIHCSLQRPAIIYNLFHQRTQAPFKTLEQYGYKIIYFQSGLIATGGWWVQPQKKYANQYLAVRNDLVEQVGKLNPSFYKWPTVRRSGKWSW
ncbi:hypothetical protein [Candidatus Parabeggiatoa sp. HSG14]|uniref:hypothetical protein n=1 Tax=Candidatus Parabeggiatoa sp. HSG14 TaxID=3055593 RepID=UPI0025A8E167|nr:hypothetical protein [Thiotrichales bacterium HSG14]